MVSSPPHYLQLLHRTLPATGTIYLLIFLRLAFTFANLVIFKILINLLFFGYWQEDHHLKNFYQLICFTNFLLLTFVYAQRHRTSFPKIWDWIQDCLALVSHTTSLFPGFLYRTMWFLFFSAGDEKESLLQVRKALHHCLEL